MIGFRIMELFIFGVGVPFKNIKYALCLVFFLFSSPTLFKKRKTENVLTRTRKNERRGDKWRTEKQKNARIGSS